MRQAPSTSQCVTRINTIQTTNLHSQILSTSSSRILTSDPRALRFSFGFTTPSCHFALALITHSRFCSSKLRSLHAILLILLQTSLVTQETTRNSPVTSSSLPPPSGSNIIARVQDSIGVRSIRTSTIEIKGFDPSNSHHGDPRGTLAAFAQRPSFAVSHPTKVNLGPPRAVVDWKSA